jgi:hypothetical protein
MSAPGFTAEDSLGRTTNHYWSAATSFGLRFGAVVIPSNLCPPPCTPISDGLFFQGCAAPPGWSFSCDWQDCGGCYIHSSPREVQACLKTCTEHNSSCRQFSAPCCTCSVSGGGGGGGGGGHLPPGPRPA